MSPGSECVLGHVASMRPTASTRGPGGSRTWHSIWECFLWMRLTGWWTGDGSSGGARSTGSGGGRWLSRTGRRPSRAAPRRLRGTGPDGSDLVEVAIVAQSQRRRRATAGNQVAKVRAIASDPHVHALAAAVTEANQRDYQIGGRPTSYPDWCLVVFGASIRVFGSASATARAFGEGPSGMKSWPQPPPWSARSRSLRFPHIGPNRDHWSYFCKRRVNARGAGTAGCAAQRPRGRPRPRSRLAQRRRRTPGRQLQTRPRRRSRRQGLLQPPPHP